MTTSRRTLSYPRGHHDKIAAVLTDSLERNEDAVPDRPENSRERADTLR